MGIEPTTKHIEQMKERIADAILERSCGVTRNENGKRLVEWNEKTTPWQEYCRAYYGRKTTKKTPPKNFVLPDSVDDWIPPYEEDIKRETERSAKKAKRVRK